VERNHNEQSTDNSQSLSINAASQDHVMVTGLNPQLLQSHSSNSDRYGAVMETEREATIAKISAPKRNINIQAATIHVLGDFIQSVGVLVAAIIIKVKVGHVSCITLYY
jgi:Co/Zn/Cd efflux system component